MGMTSFINCRRTPPQSKPSCQSSTRTPTCQKNRMPTGVRIFRFRVLGDSEVWLVQGFGFSDSGFWVECVDLHVRVER